ncbi:MAG: rRNA pseudouridine synthase [Candidatus Dadabacteria bacterium]|nr:MAG: rRNA pseudouridine synthase [Candidatus Dadabacteria bacterium]
MASMIRLHKVIAGRGYCSLRKAERLILQGKVKVNGEVAQGVCLVDPERDLIEIQGREIKPQPLGVILFHKPKKVVSTMSDPEGRRCIGDYITKRYRGYKPVGRLDWDTTGLMVLTNDGKLAYRLSHPRFGFERVYDVKVKGRLNEKQLRAIERGIKIDGRRVVGEIDSLREDECSSRLRFVLREGRNRVVRKVFQRVGTPVQKLKRIRFGPFSLGRLKSGEIRKLSHKEYLRYKSIIMGKGQ